MEEILILIKNKLDKFRYYYKISNDMLFCEQDDMYSYLEKIINIKADIDEIDGEMKKCCNGLGALGKAIIEDINNRTNRSDINGIRGEIFDISQNISSIKSAIKCNNDQISDRAKNEIEEIKHDIAKLSQSEKVTNYFKTVDTSLQSGSLLNIKK